MARRVQVLLEDDLDGGTADETVKFALDGVAYEIDLSHAHAEALRAALKVYIAAGRRAARQRSTAEAAPTERRTRRRKASGAARTGQGGRQGGRQSGNREAAAIRAWAKTQGLPVNERGRIPAQIVAQYRAAT